MNFQTSLPLPAEEVAECQNKGKELAARDNLKTPTEYIIVAVPFRADAARHPIQGRLTR